MTAPPNWIIGTSLRERGVSIAALDLVQALGMAAVLRARRSGPPREEDADMAWAVPLNPETATRFLVPNALPESVAA